MKTYYWLIRNRFLSHLRTSFCALAVIGSLLTLPTAEAGEPTRIRKRGVFSLLHVRWSSSPSR